MNILFVSEEFLPETNWGGIASCFYNQAVALAKAGEHVTVICRAQSKNSEHSYYHGYLREYRILPAVSNRLYGFFYKFPFVYIRKLLLNVFPELLPTLEWNFAGYELYKKLEKKERFDLVYTPDFHFCGMFISFLTDKPVVVYLNGTKKLTLSGAINKMELGLITFLEKLYLKRNRYKLIANSKDTSIRVKSFLKLRNNIKVLHPFLIEEETVKNIATDSGFIFFSGRLEYRKGPDILLNSFIQICNIYPNLRLMFLGLDSKSFYLSGRYVTFSEYVKETVTGNILKRINIAGPVSHFDLKKYFASCSAGIFPSRYEPFGMVILEAMAQGKPVIASSCGGSGEIIINGYNGILTGPTVNNVKRSLIRLLEDKKYSNYLGHNARKTVLAEFGEDKVHDLILFFRKCLLA